MLKLSQKSKGIFSKSHMKCNMLVATKSRFPTLYQEVNLNQLVYNKKENSKRIVNNFSNSNLKALVKVIYKSNLQKNN